ncbi:MAG: 50S ribosomal protein L21 [Clostridia bacterium]
MYAILVTGGKQYKVSEGDVIYIENLNKEAGDAVEFTNILMAHNGTELSVGAPTLEGAKVTGKVLKNGKGKKIMIFKYKPKKGYRSRQGHRQPYTKVEITAINA